MKISMVPNRTLTQAAQGVRCRRGAVCAGGQLPSDAARADGGRALRLDESGPEYRGSGVRQLRRAQARRGDGASGSDATLQQLASGEAGDMAEADKAAGIRQTNLTCRRSAYCESPIRRRRSPRSDEGNCTSITESASEPAPWRFSCAHAATQSSLPD